MKKVSLKTHSKVTNCQSNSLNKTQKTVTNFKSQSVMLNLMLSSWQQEEEENFYK